MTVPTHMNCLILFGLLASVFLSPMMSDSGEAPWTKIDEGLFVGEFHLPTASVVEDAKITIVKVNPNLYSFKLLCATEHGRVRMTARQWSEKFALIAAINAGMYQPDGFTSVGLMRNFSHFNNSTLNKVYHAVLAFNPSEPGLPEIQIIDLKCQDFASIGPRYQTLIQNIRMISCRQENVWVRKDQHRGMAVFGIDRQGQALLIFVETPYSGHELGNTLLSLPLSIFNALYLEGGREASLFFSWKGVELERWGNREAASHESSQRPAPRPIPNVIGITKKDRR